MLLLALSRRIFRALAPCLVALLACGAWAQPVHGHGGPGGNSHEPHEHFGGPGNQWHGAHGYYAFHGRDVHRFDHDDQLRWRGGRWNNACFGGRCGWWWLSGGMWYFYTRPIYPYPVIVSGIQYAEPAVVVPGVVTAPPAEQAPTPIAPPPQFWYYCDNPRGYFPAVQNCNTQFRQVNEPPPN
ncbi:MAG TPA: hypothetical protein VN617_12180 [Rhodoferax sp.]|nr:hypothetical protein [Rhodoferax sp.]